MTSSARGADAPAPPRLARGAWLAIFGLALVARLAAIAHFGFSTTRFADAPAYLGAADSLARSGTYPSRTDAHFFRAPGYPAFLAAVTLGHPSRIAAGKFANALLGSGAAVLLAALSLRIFRSPRGALAAGILGALDPSLILLGSDIQSEPLFLVLMLLSAFFLLVCADRPSSNFGVLAGAFLGLAALTRPSALALLPLWLAPLADRRYPVRVRGHLAASVALGWLIVLAPWTLRNARVHGGLIPVSDAGTIAFADGNSPLTWRLCACKTRAEYAALDRDLERWTDAQFDSLRLEGVPSGAMASALVRRTLRERLHDPAGTRRLLACKARDWLRPYPNPAFWPLVAVVPVGVFYVVLGILAIRGFAVAGRRGVVLFSVSSLIVTMAFHLATFVSWRYRTPYWDPILILYAVRGVRPRAGSSHA